MYVIFKFFGLLIVWNHWLLFRRKRHERGATAIHKVDDKKCFLYIENSFFLFDKKTVLGFPLKRSSTFKLHPENSFDRFFKSMGHSKELEVGDSQFDKKVYLESDALALAIEFANNERSREIILLLFKDGVKKIVADGQWLEVYFEGERRDIDKSAEYLVELATWLDAVPSKTYSLIRDPFLYKAMTAEFIFGGVAFTGLVSFIRESFFTTIIDSDILMSLTIKYSLYSFVVLIPLVIFIFHGSSRGHRLILENLFYIILGFPLACFFILKDINETNDNKETITISAPVVQKVARSYYRSSPSRTLPRTYSLVVNIDGKRVSIKVGHKLYYEFPDELSMEVGQGYYNQRYIKKVHF